MKEAKMGMDVKEECDLETGSHMIRAGARVGCVQEWGMGVAAGGCRRIQELSEWRGPTGGGHTPCPFRGLFPLRGDTSESAEFGLPLGFLGAARSLSKRITQKPLKKTALDFSFST